MESGATPQTLFPNTQLEAHRLQLNVLRRSAWLLGAMGLIPFVALALAAWIFPERHAQICMALLLYAVCIASFLGGIHWGITMIHHALPVVYVVSAMVWSVLPALAAWPLALLPLKLALPGATLLLIALLAGDLRMYKHYPVPTWFPALRTILTIVAAASLVAARLSLA